MFNLEQEISAWRKQMLAAGIKAPVPLEELEIHLREEIERQMKSGLSEQTAFEISVQWIGQANMLKSEFGKNEKMKLPAFLAAKCERLAGWQAIDKQLFNDDARYKKRQTSFLIAIIFLSGVLLVFYLPFFGVRLFGFGINISIMFGVAAVMICLAIRHLRFKNQRIKRHLKNG